MSIFPSKTAVGSNTRPQHSTGNHFADGVGGSAASESADRPTNVSGGVGSDTAVGRLRTVADELERVIRGKSDVIEMVLTALLAEGSLLLDDVPGVGKTTLAKSVARLIDLDYQRIQCTPDLLPADILGGPIYQPGRGEFEFRPGPVFCNLLVADEINRASPRTQSALLEAMAESQVTIDTKRYPLKHPFMVIATQNPLGFEGTFPLPESQLDRFLFRLKMDYPDTDAEISLLMDQANRDPLESLQPVLSAEDLVSLQSQTRDVTVSQKVASYIVAIATATREDSRLRVGCSPRGCKMLLRAGQARAILKGRDFVLPDDIQYLMTASLAHRVSPRRNGDEISESIAIIESICGDVAVPV